MPTNTIKKFHVVSLLIIGVSVNLCLASGSKSDTNFLQLNDFLHTKNPWNFEHILNEPDYLSRANLTNEFLKLTQVTRPLGFEFYNAWQTISEGANARALDTTCVKQITALVTGFGMNDLTSYKYFDSWGKIPAGLLQLHTTEFGNYDECVELQKLLADQTEMKGKYCFANLPLGEMLNAGALGSVLNVDIGVCMPAACSATEFDVFFKLLLKQLLGIQIGMNTQIVAEDTCSVLDKGPFDAWDWVAIVVLSLLIAAMVFSSTYEYCSKILGKTPSALLSSFSIFSNLGQLLRVQPNVKNPNVIPCLNGIRCLSLIWVIFGHTYSMVVFQANINSVAIIPWTGTAYSMLLQYAIFSVDTFFFLSGLLVAFIGLRELERSRGKLNVPMMYVHRILRLLPMLALAILVYTTLYRQLGSGPIWPQALEWNAVCWENWWSTLLFVQNYVNPFQMCIAHTWYLAVDMQLYILSPIFLLALWRYRGKGVAFVGIVALLFVACLFSMIMVNNYSYHMKGVYSGGGDAMSKTYYATHARTSPWFLGILLGYFLHVTKNTRVQLSKLLVLTGWLVSFALIASTLFCFYDKAHNHKDTSTVEEAFFWSLSRVAWPLALAWIVFASVNGYGGPINAFLACPLWEPFARLSYCAYMWHIILVEINAGRVKVNTYFSNYDVMLQFWGDFGWTLLLSTFMYLAFEAPLVNLEKLLLPKGGERRREQSRQGIVEAEVAPAQLENPASDTKADTVNAA